MNLFSQFSGKGRFACSNIKNAVPEKHIFFFLAWIEQAARIGHTIINFILIIGKLLVFLKESSIILMLLVSRMIEKGHLSWL